MNNENNTANTAEENNNSNKAIYAGIGIVVLLILLGVVYVLWGSSSKKKEYFIEDAHKLIKRDFISEKCSEGIKTYKESKKKESDQKELRGLLNQKEAKEIKEKYKEKEKELNQLRTEIVSMVSGEVIGEVEHILNQVLNDELSKDNDKTLPSKKDVQEALKYLASAKGASINSTRLSILKKTIERLDNVVKVKVLAENTKKSVNNALKKIEALPLDLLQRGNVQPYSKEALEKALNTWNNKYSEIYSQYHVAVTLDDMVEGQESK